MVIVVGLYLVIWGKTKDQSESFYPQSEMIDQQQISAKNSSSNASENDYPDVSNAMSGDHV